MDFGPVLGDGPLVGTASALRPIKQLEHLFAAVARVRAPGVRLLLAGTGMAYGLVAGVRYARRRQIRQHRAWMARAYALGLGAGTQAFTVGFGEALFGSGVVRTDLMMGFAWALNLAVAEWFIRRPVVRRAPVAVGAS